MLGPPNIQDFYSQNRNIPQNNQQPIYNNPENSKTFYLSKHVRLLIPTSGKFTYTWVENVHSAHDINVLTHDDIHSNISISGLFIQECFNKTTYK